MIEYYLTKGFEMTEWVEYKHPRDEYGRFLSLDGLSKGLDDAISRNDVQAIQEFENVIMEKHPESSRGQELLEKHYGKTNRVSKCSKKKKLEKIYRTGSMSIPETHFGELNNFLNVFDKNAPEGRQTRRGALFASPDIQSHGRWVQGVARDVATENHELIVDPDTVYVYSVDLYEESSYQYDRFGSDSENFHEACKKFWDSGMTLTEWKEWAKTNKPERGSWEIILPESAVIKKRTMRNKEIIENISEEDRESVNWILEPKRAVQGLLWRKNCLTEEQATFLKNKLTENLKTSEYVNDEFPSRIENVFRKNMYLPDEIFSSQKVIWREYKKAVEKDGGTFPSYNEANEDSEKEFFEAVTEYANMIQKELKKE